MYVVHDKLMIMKSLEAMEREKGANFLERKIDVRIEFEDDALQQLPEISPEDIESGQECYVALIGELDEAFSYVFGIAAPNEEGNTVYSFFRMYRNEDGNLLPIEVLNIHDE